MKENQVLANHFHNLGFNITCITNYITQYNFYDANILKGPCHNIEHLKLNRQSKEELNNYDWENSVGLGTVAGFNNLHVMDIDGCLNRGFIDDILLILRLPTHYEWVVKSGSQEGYHIYFYSDKYVQLEKDQVASSYPPNLDNIGLFEKIELLWDTHVVLPNSLHKSGFKYKFLNCRYPKALPLRIDINRFNIIERLFLNIKNIESKKVYYKLSKEKHKDITLPNNIEIIDLSAIKNKLLFLFDIETDGLIVNDNYPKIVQISWIIMDYNGVVYKKNTELVNSNFNLKSKAFEINKLSPEIIKQIGRNPFDVYSEITYDLNHCSVLCAHNLDFDISVLKNEFKESNIQFDFDKLEKFCTLKWGHQKAKSETKPNPKFPKLTEVYRFLFNHEINQLHNSQSDVTTLAKCVKEILYTNQLIYN